MKLVACSVLLVACVPGVVPAPAPPAEPFAYYIAAIRRGPGALAAIHRCALDMRGLPTGQCYDQYVGANSEDVLYAELAMARGPVLPANPRPPASPPAPKVVARAADVVVEAMREVNDREVRSRVADCQHRYGTKPLHLLRFGLDVTGDGDVSAVQLRGDVESFVARCTSDALEHAHFSPEVAGRHYELAMAL